MKIAIQAADLDAPRIDGTRVYILNLLKYFGKLDSSSQFLIYHKNEFNPELIPPDFPNYKIIKKSQPHLWTQTRFAGAMWRDKPDVLWMPMHNMPILIRGKIKTVVTIHDLAFKYFPETFTSKDLFKINFLTRVAVMFADRIITISESSKRDIMKFYPGVKEEEIKVIYHGFDAEVFKRKRDLKKEEEIKKQYNISGNYIIYIGAIQPRKNLEKLVEAFEILKKSEPSSDLKLVLVGEHAWMSEGVFEKIEKSPYKNDIITPGRIDFEPLGHLLRGARAFVFPSLYEGFGIPILEAFASRVPVVCSKNSSLPEVGGDAAIYFEDNNAADLAKKIENVITDENLRQVHISKGLEQIKKFSWEKCARETLEYLKS
ncbi:MAG: glycosyltransferase family 1 protein [Parcubacteria group bacterium]|jgi:glycosyltransferase involved in cell wall biosynthesis